ncbi:MAG: XisI protein [Planctomycetes bacterium]|nr:XisI protein [Planctomycetota bacterium]
MDKRLSYRQLIERHISDLASLIREQHPASRTGVECECVFDEQRDHYLLLKIGWSGSRRIRATTLHVRLRDGKIWVEEDMTEEGIATALLRQGVPPEDMVLAFHPPALRKHTESAAV